MERNLQNVKHGKQHKTTKNKIKIKKCKKVEMHFFENKNEYVYHVARATMKKKVKGVQRVPR